MRQQSMDGCTAAAYIAYAFSEVATIYPITPIASMGETADKWNMAGLRNLLGAPMQVREMESELGAAGATHGALTGGALATTFTSSQGLMLMIPNMYKIAGELLPAVFHVGCRSLATHALSIFGDHQDVMACRATGFAMLASASVQETHDLAIAAHIAAIEGRVPVLHFFDGWRTSNETATIDTLSYEELQPLLPKEAVAQFRKRAMNPEHPDLRGSAQNWDVYFQNTEARNKYYDDFPATMQKAMDQVNEITGRNYHLVDYAGAPDAEYIIISIGSSTQVTEYAVDWLNSRGGKYGILKIRLYRPFPVDAVLNAIPASVRRIAVLDRTKEHGATGEPLYLDVCAAIKSAGRDIMVVGGRYGLGSKNFDPTMVQAVLANLRSDKPVHDFTVGIDDDVTHRSLPLGNRLLIPSPDVTSAVFYGMGSDGTVGATRTAARIIGGVSDLYSQAYFEYSAKKSGGFTVCQLRFSKKAIPQAYTIEQADYVACNKSIYVNRFDLIDNLTQDGVFVLNAPWTPEQMNRCLPAPLKRGIAAKKAKFYVCDALKIARDNNLGVRINMIMLSVFFRLTNIIPYDEAIAELKKYISTLYAHEGGVVVKNNINAIDQAVNGIVDVVYDTDKWLAATEASTPEPGLPEFVAKIAKPCLDLRGDSLPVSVFTPDGVQCSFVCPHAVIRPYMIDGEEMAQAPNTLTTAPAHMAALKGLNYRIQVYPQDCTGCGSWKSIWAIGGDGWAYDIGFAGLDHVLAQNVDINILVMDTECYSNTGGQTSKATPLGAVAKYSADGKRTYKKDLGNDLLVYNSRYVAGAQGDK